MSLVKQPKGRSKPVNVDVESEQPTVAETTAKAAVNRAGRGPSKSALARRKRFERKPRMGRRMILHAESDDPNMVLKWVEYTPERLTPLMDRGYEPETRNGVELNDTELFSGANVGSLVTKRVGQGKELILVKIPREWYDADRTEKAKFAANREAAIHGKTEGGYGEVKVGARVGAGEPGQVASETD